ncbi:DUF3148 domain-containing protein [Synechococcus sp. CS-1329]|uniref:NAD(P)H dehydrogenase assembly family protein n=1 Tax=Synechococcus sp. CS-1329 TaxID=2847975 RepID=UPI002880AE12|nr:NAD(P)H dehydrogenase assembly family protein [Synechococcus sp. CS-1329]MCT0219167.1 DUF3148 domain-containing protein [Synechococcus sp. CS-1329]
MSTPDLSTDPPIDHPSDQPLSPGTEPAPATFTVGEWVQITARITYLKTADPMPMLRPPDLVDADEVGQVMALRAINQVAVRFRRGTFLLGADQLSACTPEGRPRG